MISTQFDYVRAQTLDEAITLLAQNEDAKILAGGHSLIPAMKLRLATPSLLIDIGRIADLCYVREEGNQVLIGAMTSHYQIESSELLKQICPLLPECAGHIGDVQVRNKGTIGGSLAHSDPAGDWPAAAIALNAELVVAGPNGDRVISVNDFFVDLMTTAIKPGEILREIRIGKLSGRTGQAYTKMHHPASGFAVVGVATSLTLDESGICRTAGIGITGVSAKAYRAAGIESALVGHPLDEQSIANAAVHATDGVDVNGDLFASESYRRHLAQVYSRRAISMASGRA
jgi:carbon-monoxide dehydrogenase medium subunit